MEIDIESEEYMFYDQIRSKHLKSNKPVIVDGEAAVITLSHMHMVLLLVTTFLTFMIM